MKNNFQSATRSIAETLHGEGTEKTANPKSFRRFYLTNFESKIFTEIDLTNKNLTSN